MTTKHAVLPLLLLALLGCSKEPVAGGPASAEALLPALKVELAPVRLERVPHVSEVVGTVRPAQRALIAAKVMGAIEELPVVLGQKVAKGELLVRISAGENAARLQQALSQLNQVRRDLERERILLPKGATTAETVRSLEDRLAMAEAAVREAEVMLAYTEVRAPFDGLVSRRLANLGDLAAPGQPLLEVEGLRDFQVEAAIPDSLAAALAPGALLEAEIPVLGLSLQASLVELSSAADSLTRSVPAKLSLPEGRAALRSGQFVRLRLKGAAVDSLRVPEAALLRQGQIEAVFVVGGDGHAVLRLVRTGAQRDGLREILAGLEAGDRVVARVPAGLREGRKLEVAP